ncbi:FAD-binding protein, partial [Mycobacterium timonense]|uniref:FAD-binding protein n=1 Tax=Mycobacterium timonense TaxID=701043 RepID=UPI001B802C0A
LPANGPQFATGKQVFNSFCNNSNPAAVVRVSSQADVQKAVAFAKANNLKIAPRGGVHSVSARMCVRVVQPAGRGRRGCG